MNFAISRLAQELDVILNGAGFVKQNGQEIVWQLIGLDELFEQYLINYIA